MLIEPRYRRYDLGLRIKKRNLHTCSVPQPPPMPSTSYKMFTGNGFPAAGLLDKSTFLSSGGYGDIRVGECDVGRRGRVKVAVKFIRLYLQQRPEVAKVSRDLI